MRRKSPRKFHAQKKALNSITVYDVHQNKISDIVNPKWSLMNNPSDIRFFNKPTKELLLELSDRVDKIEDIYVLGLRYTPSQGHDIQIGFTGTINEEDFANNGIPFQKNLNEKNKGKLTYKQLFNLYKYGFVRECIEETGLRPLEAIIFEDLEKDSRGKLWISGLINIEETTPGNLPPAQYYERDEYGKLLHLNYKGQPIQDTRYLKCAGLIWGTQSQLIENVRKVDRYRLSFAQEADDIYQIAIIPLKLALEVIKPGNTTLNYAQSTKNTGGYSRGGGRGGRGGGGRGYSRGGGRGGGGRGGY